VERQLAQIVVVLDQDVERAELDLMVVLAGVQGVEVDMPSTPRITASPSSTNRFWRTLWAALTIQG
jgi:hypothetical protein